MTEADEHEREDEHPRETGTPSSEELDLEAPNESAPGHEPSEDRPREGAERPQRGEE